MKLTPIITVLLVAALAASAAAAENIVAPKPGEVPAESAGAMPETSSDFGESLETKLDELKQDRQDNSNRIIAERDKFADELERAGLTEWAEKSRAFTRGIAPASPRSGGTQQLPPVATAPRALTAMPDRPAAEPQSITVESLIIWGAIGVLWMVALASLRGLRRKTRLHRLAWLLAVPAVAVLLLAAAALRPALDGRELLPAFLAPGNFLVLILCALAYLAIRLFHRKAWKRAFALVGGVGLAFGLVALGASVGMGAIPEDVGGIKITGEKHIASDGTITIERIASEEGYNVAWSVSDLRVRVDAAALMWGNLRGVDIRIGEVNVFIDRSKQSPPKKEGEGEGEKEPMTVERVIKHLRSLGGVEIEKIVVRMAREGKEPLTIFEGGTSVTRYSADGIGGEVTGRILSMSNISVKWRGDLAQRSVVTQFDFGGLEFDTDTIARLMPDELGVDLTASGWQIGGGLGVSGEVKLVEGARPEWFVDVRLSAGVLQWPGLPLPMIGINGAILVNENGASVHNLRGRIATDQNGTPPMEGMGDFVMSGEIDMSGNGTIEAVSTGFPVSEGWLAMLVGDGQDWLERLGLTGSADFRSTLRISFEDGVPAIENIRTEVMPSRLLISPVEPKVNLGINLITFTADGDDANVMLGDGNLAGGKLFGKIRMSLADMKNSSGQIMFTDVQFQKLQGLNSGAELKGRMHGDIWIKDISLQSTESFEGAVWVEDVNTSIDPILSKLLVALSSPIGGKIPDSDTCDVYCSFSGNENGLKIHQLRAFTGIFRIDAAGTVDYAGNLELNGSLSLGTGALDKIPGGDFWKKLSPTRFTINGDYGNPKITIDPAGISNLKKLVPLLPKIKDLLPGDSDEDEEEKP